MASCAISFVRRNSNVACQLVQEVLHLLLLLDFIGFGFVWKESESIQPHAYLYLTCYTFLILSVLHFLVLIT